MKQIKALLAPVIVLLVVFVNASKCYAVEDDDAPYRPFVEDGKSWVVTLSISHGMMPVFQTETYYFDGDTIIFNKLWKKLMCRTADASQITTSLCALLYEEKQRVMCLTREDFLSNRPNVLPLYDFSSQPGDTLSLLEGLGDNNHITKEYYIWDSFEFESGNGLFHGLLATIADSGIAEPDEYTDTYKWYECIGSRMHPFEKITWNKNKGGMLYLLRDCRIGTRIVYQNWSDGLMFPDTNGDGQVDISDVNAAIDVMLGKSAATADVTGDGEVDIADVNAIIDQMLGKR